MPRSRDPVLCPCNDCHPLSLLQQPDTVKRHMERQTLARDRQEAADTLLQESRASHSARPSDEDIIPDSDNADPFPPPHSPSPERSSHRAQDRTSVGGDRFPPVLPTSALPPAGVTANQGALAQFLDEIFEELSIGAQETRGDPGEIPWNEPVYSAPAPAPDGDGDGEPTQAPREIEDTLRQSNSSLFEQDDESDAPFISTPLDDVRSVEDLAPPAFEEDPILRNIYIRAYVQAAFHGATHSDIANLLADQKATLQALSDREGFDLDLTKMALTLRTVERRLGLSVDDQIIYYFICPACWDVHHPTTLSDLDSSICGKSGCTGELYVESIKDGRRKRTPTKILPYASLSSYIRRMLLRPGKAEELQSWRRAGDEVGPSQPQSFDEWRRLHPEDQPLYDIHDGSAWRAVQAGLERRIDYTRRRAYDINARPQPLRFVSLPLGLLLTMNLDWFQPMATRVHSSGAIYFVVNNLPRPVRNLRENTFLVCVLPGPHEPSKEQMNSVLGLIQAELEELRNGVQMSMLRLDPDDKPVIIREHTWTELFLNCSDGPARSKANGTASCNCERHMCPECKATFLSLIDPNTYDPSTFISRDPHEQLFWKLVARNADQARRDLIFEEKGVRYSALDDVPNWFGPARSPPDPMHVVILGDTAFIHKEILTALGMFNTFSGRDALDQPFSRFQACLRAAWWPSWVARVPTSVHKGGKIKADQWRNLLPIYVIALYQAWQVDGQIPTDSAPTASSRANVTRSTARLNDLARARRLKYVEATVADYDNDYRNELLLEAEELECDRRYSKHYDAVCNFVAGASILLRQSISPRDAERAEGYFGRSFRAFATMGCPLTPNFHTTMHLREKVLKYGPVYGWWAYPFERMNGILGRFNLNGRAGGEIEATMLRGWLKSARIQELLVSMQDLEEKTPDDTYTIKRLLEAVAGGAESKRARGTFLSYIASLGQRIDEIVLPQRHKLEDLQSNNIYDVCLQFARESRPDWGVIRESAAALEGQHRLSFWARSHATVSYRGLKYGASSHPAGRKSCYAYYHERRACRIESIYALEVYGQEQMILCCKVRPFVPTQIRGLPWHLYAGDIGIDTWTTDEGEPLLIRLDMLSGHFGWVDLTIQGQSVRVSFSLDHRFQEPDSVDVVES